MSILAMGTGFIPSQHILPMSNGLKMDRVYTSLYHAQMVDF